MGLSLAYGGAKLYQLVEMKDPQINQYKEGMNLLGNPEVYNLD